MTTDTVEHRVVHKSGRLFPMVPGSESWCESIVRVLGDEWTVEKA